MIGAITAVAYFAFCEFLMWRQRCRCRADMAEADRWEREVGRFVHAARKGERYELTVGAKRIRFRVTTVEERDELPF